MADLKQRWVLVAALLSPWFLAPQAQAYEELILLLQDKRCPQCRLADVDLVHADLRDADLSGAELQRANLGQARLDGADLRESNLQFTNLRGASLRGADLRGSTLYGADLRQADLSGAQLDEEALEQAHWQGARGIGPGARTHAGLHNAGVAASENQQWKLAESLFNEAISAYPSEPLSWIARGLARGELGKFEQASADLAYAGQLFEEKGDTIKAKQLRLASQNSYTPEEKNFNNGNGIGSAILSGTISTFRALAPIALRLISP